MPSTKNVRIRVFSPDNTLAETVHKTLSHVYPGIKTETASEDAESIDSEFDLAIVDALASTGAKLEHLLDRLPDAPVLLIVEGIADMRDLCHLIKGRRELVTKEGLAGIALIQAVHHLLERQRLHKQLKKTSRHLKDLSIRDDMTRLYNHRHFNELLTQEAKKANRYKRPLGLVMIALKNFTAINETYGHHEGDRLLSRAAGIINATMREVDVTARYGDNEFAVILPESDEAAAMRAAQRIYDALNRLTVTDGDGEHTINVSVGAAALGEGITTKKELLKAALRALIEAKKSPRHPIKSASDTLGADSKLKENRQMIDALHERLGSIARRAERGFFHETLKAIAEIPAQRKFLTPHAERVAFYAERLAGKRGLNEREIKQIRRAGLLHDIGKLAIDLEVLNKPGALTQNELKLIKQHPLFGSQIIGIPKFLEIEPELVLYHHEQYDGSGYPEGLAGAKIPIGARIIAITEAWDTMITPQPYRKEPMPFDKALAELKSTAGKQFDPELVETFTCLITG
jgi:diguanylate cyclase (GGDEF)-like protein